MLCSEFSVLFCCLIIMTQRSQARWVLLFRFLETMYALAFCFAFHHVASMSMEEIHFRSCSPAPCLVLYKGKASEWIKEDKSTSHLTEKSSHLALLNHIWQLFWLHDSISVCHICCSCMQLFSPL